MNTIERIVASLNKITSVRHLAEYLRQFTQVPHIQWCSLIVHEQRFTVIGSLPEEVQKRLVLPSFRHAYHYKPVWGSENPKDKSILPEDTLLIPIVGSKSNQVFFALGYEKHGLPLGVVTKLSWFWQIVGTYVYDTYRRLSGDSITNEVQLTQREIECVQWAAQGKTSWEISRILSVSERTVNFHLSNSMQKTGSVNRQQLVYNCMNLELF